ncbi:MAG TPA: DUF3299 domain-containing protein [Methylophaga sp.]|nr:DUF3299 domain-containing protein [Methylophaga sp.]HEC58877.1 DUF3299 domain-containing protein [Methylophaga sp.]
MKKLFVSLFLAVSFAMPATAISADKESQYQTIEWVDLLPEEDLNALMEPPESLDDIEDGSEEDQLSSQLTQALELAGDSRYQQALVSTIIRPEYNDRKVRMPGFIVPITLDKDQNVTEFFLVPYFGACIHVPPPPPNQIIFSKLKTGIKIENIYEAYWVEGTLSTTLTENEMATSAYAFTVDKVVPYEEPLSLE